MQNDALVKNALSSLCAKLDRADPAEAAEVRAAAKQSSDRTRYDITTEDGVHQALYKREVVLAAIQQLLKRITEQSSIMNQQVEALISLTFELVGCDYVRSVIS